MSDPLHDLLELIGRRRLLPPSYMALLLKQDLGELQVRLDVAARLGWLAAERACCGREWRYSVTELGGSMLVMSGPGTALPSVTPCSQM